MISTSWDFSFRADGFETKTQKYSHKISSRIISGEQVHKIVDVSTQNRWMLHNKKNNFQLPGVPVETPHFWWWKPNVHVIDLHIFPCFDATRISGNITFDRWIPACHSLPIFWQWTRKAWLICPWFRVGMCRTPSVHQASIQPHPSTSFHIYLCGI